MANHTGKDGVVTIGGNTVAELVDWSVDEGANIVDDTSITDTADTHQVGTTNWTGAITVHWDEADTTGQEAMTVGTSVTILFLPEGNTTGDVSLTGTATVTARSLSSGINAMVAQSFTLQGSGALTRGTVA